MNGLLLILLGCAWFALCYRFYGRRLERTFGVDGKRKTPALARPDGVDYVPTRPLVLFGHHFASIAGAGPIVGPILALHFGWAPVALWIVFGCVFVGAMHDFAAMYISVRDEGRSIGHEIERRLGYGGRQSFILFSWATLILVVAVFADLVATTFTSQPSVATASLLMIAVAPVFGWLVYRRGVPLLPASLVFAAVLFLCVWAGAAYPLDLAELAGISAERAKFAWLAILLGYSFVASVLPVWILLQPRDYLNSFLLYGMLLAGFAGIALARPTLEAPMFTGWTVPGNESAPIHLFPLLFVTVACGACSGFHALVASGTTSKQLSSERHILPVGYGSMLVEGALALMAVVSVAYLSRDAMAEALSSGGPVVAFSNGLGGFVAATGIDRELAANFFMLAISAFLLTTLDTATRLARFAWQELFLPRGGDERAMERRGQKALASRYTGAMVVIVLAGYLAFSGQYSAIWPMFGASNQLLAGLTLLVVTVFLRAMGKPVWISLLPMIFMMATCTVALLMLLRVQIGESLALAAMICLLLAMSATLLWRAIRELTT